MKDEIDRIRRAISKAEQEDAEIMDEIGAIIKVIDKAEGTDKEQLWERSQVLAKRHSQKCLEILELKELLEDSW